MKGIETKSFGIGKNQKKKDNYMEGVQLIGRQTVLAEGCRGSLSEKAIETFDLRKGKAP